MNVIIFGAGQIGSSIARHAAQQNIEVTVIDRSENSLQRLIDFPNISLIVGNVFDAEILKKANINESSYIIAALDSDEQNIVASKITDSLFNPKMKIVLLKSQIFMQGHIFELFLRENFAIDVIIQPENKISEKIRKIIEISGALDVIDLQNLVVVRTICHKNSEILNTAFMHLQEIADINLFILSITRDGRTFFPTRDDNLLVDDEIFFIVPRENLNEAMRLLGNPSKDSQNLLIIGGKSIEHSLIQELSYGHLKFNITVLEDSLKQAEKIAEHFSNHTIIHGDPVSENQLRDVSKNTDTAIVCTNSEKTNIISSMLLDHLKIERILTISSNHNYESLLSIIKKRALIDPGNVIIEAIFDEMNQNKNFNVTSVQNHSFYLVNLKIPETFSEKNANAESITRENQIIPIYLIRDEKITLFQQNTSFGPGDQLVILSVKECIKVIEKFFFSYSFLK